LSKNFRGFDFLSTKNFDTIWHQKIIKTSLSLEISVEIRKLKKERFVENL
jgi:hypothetical protein